MPDFKLTNEAVKDLSNIWEYTFEYWSEYQADKYYKMLISTCHKIAKNPDIGKNYEGILDELLGVKAKRHIIFYRNMNKEYVEITRILHEKMDLKNRINE